MQIILDEAIRSDPELTVAVERTTPLVLEELGRASERVSIEWGLERDEQDQPLLRLTLNDREIEIARSAEFKPTDLSNEIRFSSRVNWLWDSVLQASIEKRLARIDEALQTIQDN